MLPKFKQEYAFKHLRLYVACRIALLARDGCALARNPQRRMRIALLLANEPLKHAHGDELMPAGRVLSEDCCRARDCLKRSVEVTTDAQRMRPFPPRARPKEQQRYR